MAKPSLSDLNFGHFGHATYDLENSEWAFARESTRKNLRVLVSWRTALPASTICPEPRSTQDAYSSKQAVKGVVRDLSDIAPAAKKLTEPALVSAAVTATSAVHDPAKNNLLAFGSIPYDARHTVVRRVGATVTGEGGNILRLVILANEQSGWGNERSVFLEGYAFREREAGYWAHHEEAGPIQQLCFSHAEAETSFLAVRLLTRTVVFQPACRRHRVPAPSSQYYELPPSTIDPCPIFETPIADTGATPHADVSFNPDYHRQFGLVDQAGNWSIWDIESGYRRTQHTAACTARGSIMTAEPAGDPSPDFKAELTGEDGWARILWIGNVTTILVCNRRNVKVLDIRSPPTELRCSEIVPARSGDWILDVKATPNNKDQLLVLTSSRLIILAVTCSSENLISLDSSAGATTTVSWTHFRGLEDVTLRLCVYAASDKETFIIMHSRINTLATIFQFQDSNPGTTSVSAPDPFLLNFGSIGLADSQQVNELYVEKLQFNVNDEDNSAGPGRLYRDEDVHFYQLSAMLSDLSIQQTTLCASSNTHLLPSIEPTSWRNVPRRRDYFINEEREVGDDFIVEDGLEHTSTVAVKEPYRRQRAVHHSPLAELESTRITDFSVLYNSLVQTDPSENVRDIVVVFDELRGIMNGSSQADVPMGTLMEITQVAISVIDVDEASSNLQDILSAEHHAPNVFMLQQIVSPHVLDLATERDLTPTISSMYDMVLQKWIASLPSNVPARIRQAKERLVRRIAVEIMLASHRFRTHETPQSSPVDVDPGLVDDTSQQLVVNPLSRLGKYFEIIKPVAPFTSPEVTQVLAHLQIGSDPNTYDWEATERETQAELSDEDEESSQQKREKEQEKERERKRKQRFERNQKREDELAKEQARSLPLFPRSSPGPMTLGMGSQAENHTQLLSSQSLGGFIVQSQVEPGRHGGRPAKKKLRSRLSGF
ncbi:RNA polymerase I-specific transcription initiation factor RRN6-like protein [Massariosphaeria phaeospora]|uniref:RNA polymerase I-specific transcription initiation factor RRN6-like protein n=1 Tax=Massariosphaeria phaeospora TaxID=100035 RepID=A0A7C8I2J6_9PLEO|nr:RNA polymerase I-specific transcription initiation factor RRN6-like protein [Massariosphaeria phaeospora]